MEIKSYRKLKNNVYELTFDNKEKYKLFDDIIVKYELLISKKMDKRKLEMLLDENTKLEAYYKALKLISIKMRTELEIRKYLLKYNYNKKSVDAAIKRLTKEDLINPENYAQAYVNDSMNLTLNGPEKIRDNLKKLGIDDNTSEKYLSKIKTDEWIERIKVIISKKMKLNKNSEKMFKNKMYRELILLGYEIDDIKLVLKEINIDDKEIFLKDAEKIYKKCLERYPDQVEYTFKNKMYAKGYEIDDINEYLNNQ